MIGKASSKIPTYDLLLSIETQKGLRLNLAFKEPAVDSGPRVANILDVQLI